MTDPSQTSRARVDWNDPALRDRLSRRHRAERRLRLIGIASIGLAFLMLALLVGSLTASGWSALRQTHVTMEFFVDPALVKPDKIDRGRYRNIIDASLESIFPEVTDRKAKKALRQILSNGAQFALRDRVVADPSLIGQTITMTVPVSDPFDQLAKGNFDRETPQEQRRVSDQEIAWFDRLVAEGRVTKPFNWGLFTNADSRFPELAGLKGALIGSFWALLVCFVLSFPLGIGAGVYMEEFAPKNRFSDIIEVNINNLAAVPSVVFGLLALAVFIGWFGLPRSTPIVGGMALAVMTMPTIFIATRVALKAVPPSIREAALGVGASQHQVVFGHVLPLAMPGIMTGTIIGLARALGETAPLLLIGMNAFITAAPDGPFSPSTALPTQIFIWADSPERGFVSRTSAAIVVLLGFLIVMNGLAIWLRNKFERKW